MATEAQVEAGKQAIKAAWKAEGLGLLPEFELGVLTRAAIDAAEAAAWQPIETAPKDEEILLWHGRWNVGAWHPESFMRAVACWVINGGYIVRPTSWAPLPVKRSTDDPPK